MRAVIAAAVLVVVANAASPSQQEYPPLTRATLVGTWEAVIGIGTVPVVFHIVIAPRDSDSYMAEIYPDHNFQRTGHSLRNTGYSGSYSTLVIGIE